MSLALAIIAKDEIGELKRIIGDYGKYFDEIAIAYDNDTIYQALHADERVKLYPYTWCDDFSHKRNFLADKIQSQYYFRMDTDDEIEHPENIRALYDKMVKHNLNLVYIPYIYSKDPDGNCIAEHWRETIIKKQPDIYWKKSIHENIFAEDETKLAGMKADSVRLIHNLTPDHAQASTKRNLKLLVKEFEQDGENADPRTIAYIGRVFMGMGAWKESIPFLELLIQKSGWDDDKYFAWVHLAECHKSLGNLDLAIGACNEALEVNTSFPDAYISKGTVHLMKGNYDKALDWLMYGLVRKKPDTMFVIDPSVYGWRVRLAIALSYLGKGCYEEALKWFLEAKGLCPTNHDIISKEKTFLGAYESNKYVQNLIEVIKYTKDPDSIAKIVETIPENILQDERGWAVKNKYCKPIYWSRKSVVIYCGISWEDWTPPNVLSGIGGSEEAVIYLAKELVKQGWEVTVFNQCGDNAGTYDGVVYKNYYEFNVKDTFHIFVAWRHDIFKNSNIRCRKKIVWLHDVPNKDEYKDAKTHLDKVVVLSQFHKSLLPKLPERNVYVSSNGINIEDFKPSLLPRNPHRMIFTSSYDRGIEHLLVMWKDIKEAVPDAELHLFYGWDTYDKMLKAGRRSVKYRQLMAKLMEQEGIFEHGRIGHKQLIKEFYKSGIWVYPSHFEEISCISAMKAQACGCVPVCVDYAALDETVKGGIKVHGKCGNEETNELFKQKLIQVLKDTDYQEKLRKELPDKNIFSWERVAKKWIDELFILENIKYDDISDYEDIYAVYGWWNPQPLEQGWELARYTWAMDFLAKHPELKTGIDIGSFDGALAVYCTRKFKDRFVCDAQDIKSIEFNFAREVIKKEGLGTQIYSGCAIERFETDKKYDIVFLMEILEHTIDPQVVLKKICSLLNEGGYLIITVPDKDGGFGREKDELFNGAHLRDYTEETLRAEVAPYFEEVEFKKSEELLNIILKKK